MNVRYRVDPSQAERDQLSALLSGGTHALRKLKRAQILLAADAGVSDNDIAASIAVGGSTVYRTRRSCACASTALASATLRVQRTNELWLRRCFRATAFRARRFRQ